MAKFKNEIINLELLTRDNPIYTTIEERTNYLNDTEISYIFCEECSFRSKDLKEFINFTDEFIEENHSYPKVFQSLFIDHLTKLKNINIDLYAYFGFLMFETSYNYTFNSTSIYSVQTMIDEPVLINSLGKDRVDELLYHHEVFIDKGYPYLDFGYLITQLTEEEYTKIRNYIKNNPFGFRTTILRDYARIERDLTQSYFVEIDLSKPIEEIESFIKTIKKDFENNKVEPNRPNQTFRLFKTRLPTMYDLLNIKTKKVEFHTLKDSSIYRSTNRKTNNQLLTDILFIYDCNKAGFTQDDIKIEFSNYYGYSIKKDTIKRYLEFAKSYIDKKKYLDFLNPIK